jgi:hypothetical protein
MVDHLTSHPDQQDEETKAIFGSFNVFEARLKQIFGTPGEEQAASQRLQACHIRPRSLRSRLPICVNITGGLPH